MSKMQIVLLVALSQFFLATAKAQDDPPVAPVREVTDTYFGTKIIDPYRWMENLKDPEVVSWMKAQNTYTRTLLDRISGRQELLARIRELDNAGVVVTSVRRVGEQYFYYKTAPGDESRKLYVRDGLEGTERLLIDPDKLSSPGKHYSIDYFEPSLDGRYVAYGVSPSGSEDSVLRVIGTSTGRELSEHIDRAQLANISWLPGGQSFFYNRLAKLAPEAASTERYQKNRAYLHVLGADPDKDEAVIGYGLSPEVKVLEDDFSFGAFSSGSPYVFGLVGHGVQNEISLYAAALSSLNGASTPWRKVIDVDDQVTNYDVHGDDLYLLTHRDASRFKVIRTKLSAPNVKQAEVLVAPGDAVVKSLSVAEDALYVQLLEGGIGRLLRVPFTPGAPVELISLPVDGTILSLVTEPRRPGALVRLESWTKSPLWYAYDPRTKRVSDTRLMPPSPVDFSQIESIEVKVRSVDGTPVPLSIVYKRGLARDGSHPTLLTGYGAYGFSYDPHYDPTLLPWLERGGIYAIAHVRGGGEYGEEWHQAGMKLTKQNTISDFIACAEYLIREKYTSAKFLGGEGRSAGSITISGAITQRPDLFAAALIIAGLPNVLRFEEQASGPANAAEFGSVKTPEGFKTVYAMDAYHHVKQGIGYPAVLLATGITDLRAAPWQSAKMTARLQAASRSGRPVLLRVNYDEGHGFGSTKLQRDELAADKYAFLFWQFGKAEYKPLRQRLPGQ